LFLLTVVLSITALTVAAVDKTPAGVTVTDPEHNAQTLLDKADTTFQSRDYAAAFEEYRQAADLAREEFNRSVEVEALSQMARMKLILNEKDEADKWLEQAASRVDELDPMGYSRYLGVKGRFEWKAGDLKTARETFEKMYTFCDVNALWGRAVDAAHMIGIVAETPEDQIKWGQRGIEAAEAADVERWLGPLYNNLAITYYEQKQYDSALANFIKAREYHWRHSDEIGKLFADYHVGMTYRHMGKFEEAGKWLRPVLAWAERIEYHGAIGQTCEELGEIAVAQGDTAEGLKLLRRAKAEYKAEGYDESWPDIWQNINKRLDELEG
jgi:tetratricopeptide (TPR) repeat protein